MAEHGIKRQEIGIVNVLLLPHMIQTHTSKITVIGGSGFVGTNFCQQLAEKQIPFEIIDIKQSARFPEKCKIADVRDSDTLRQTITGDVVVNLAAVHRDDIRDKSEYHRTNVEGAANIAQVCSEKAIRKIIFTSTVAVYGFAEEGADETAPIKPFNDYGRTKFEAEEILRDWQSQAENALIIIRPTVIFGEGNRGNVFNLLNQIVSGRFVMVGNGTNKKSMAYIGNVVAFLEQSVKSQQSYAVYNYIDTPDMDMNSLVQQVRHTLTGRDNVGLRLPYWFGLILGYMADGVALLTRKKLPVSAIRVKKFCATTSFSSNKSSLDGFNAPYTLQDGIARTLDSEFLNPDPDREIFFTE